MVEQQENDASADNLNHEQEKSAVESGKCRFRTYYQAQKLVDEGEWDSFWNTLVSYIIYKEI